MYYTEGTIDAIELHDDCFYFSISPSSAFLIDIDGDRKMALFIEDKCNIMTCDIIAVGKNSPKEMTSRKAKLTEPTKNRVGKEVLWFHWSDLSGIHSCNFSRILVDAKNNRNAVRVCTNIPNANKFTVMAAHSLRIM